jgi:DNA-binding MarR family transcriptional regulator
MMTSKQLEPFYSFNPKLSVSALRIFLRVAEAGIPGVHQNQLNKLLSMQQSTISRQLSILCSRTEKNCPGMCLLERRPSKIRSDMNVIHLTETGKEVYDLLTCEG